MVSALHGPRLAADLAERLGSSQVSLSAKRGSTETVPWEPKDHEIRQIPLGDQMIDLLTQLQAEAPENVPYVFLTRSRYAAVMGQLKESRWHEGKNLTNNVLREFNTIRRRAGVGPCTIHDLRRSSITNWARKLPAHMVRKLAGHSSLDTTMKYYLIVQETDLRRAKDIGDDVLNAGLTDQIVTNSSEKRGISSRKVDRAKRKAID